MRCARSASSRGPAAGSSAGSCSAGNPSSSSRTIPSAGASSRPASPACPSTTTCGPSTPSPARPTSSPAASPASPTPRPGSGSEGSTTGTSGPTPFAYCERVALPSGSSRTYPVSSQASMLTDCPTSDVSSVTFPRSGSMSSGRCYRRPTWERRTGATDSGSWPTPHGFSKDGRSNGPSGNELGRSVNQWPTPSRTDGERGGAQPPWKRRETGHQVNLEDAAKWPTPRVGGGGRASIPELEAGNPHGRLEGEVVLRGGSTPPTWRTPAATDGTHGGPSARDSSGAMHLSSQACWSTPVADDTGHRRTPYAQGGEALSYQTSGSLSPEWVEWLMGWPRGFTDLGRSGTARSLRVWPARSRCWLAGLDFYEQP